MRRAIFDMRWTIMLSVLLGLLLSYWIKPNAIYDWINPVVTMSATVAQKSPTEVIVKLDGRKQRDCKYEGISAYSQAGDMLHSLNMERIDQPETGATRPTGRFSFGSWRIWPTGNTKLVVVYVQYDCDGRDVHVRAAEISL